MNANDLNVALLAVVAARLGDDLRIGTFCNWAKILKGDARFSDYTNTAYFGERDR